MKIGDKIPNKKYQIGTNKEFTVNDLKGKKTVIYFYPKDDTPGCTKEGIEFSELKKDFDDLNTVIFGISKDSLEKHEKFKKKHDLLVELISDESVTICDNFGVGGEKSMYGKKYMGIERSTFLFDEELNLIKFWRKVKVKNHAKEVLESIKNLS